MAKFEKMVRRGIKFLPKTDRTPHKLRGAGKVAMLQAFLRKYILTHSEKSPALQLLLVEPPCNREFYAAYKQFVAPAQQVTKKTFLNYWYEQMREQIVDPATGDTLSCKIRKCQANGFKACDECERLKLLVKLAETIQQKSITEGEQIVYHKSVKRDREAVDNLCIRCRTQRNCVGFVIDGADSHK